MCSALDGALGASVMGYDGIPIDSVEAASGQADVSSLLVEYSLLLDQVKKSAQMFAAGELEEMSVSSENITTIIRPLTSEYFAALALGPGSSLGRGRYLLRRHAVDIIEALG